MNNIGLEVIFWTVLALYLLTKLGVFKKWKKVKKISNSQQEEDVESNIETNTKSQEKPTKIPNENEQVEFLDKKNEIEFENEINNARKKRRRSSANIE